MKRKIFIINSHWNNRGDEAALRSLMDSFIGEGYEISVQLCSSEIEQFPYNGIKVLDDFPRVRHIPELFIAALTRNKICPKIARLFMNELMQTDLVLHGPGGPSIGDVYGTKEFCYLIRLWAAYRMRVPYIICAPSAGPFKKKLRNIFRRFIYRNAEKIILREEISKRYLDDLMTNDAIVTCDLAIQNEIDLKENEKKFLEYKDLATFIGDGSNVVGMTVTDLLWHPRYGRMEGLKETIDNTFKDIVEWLVDNKYKVLFIPQQFGMGNDYKYMMGFCIKECFVMSDTYDCYFQQFVIGKLYAVIGMRYHSNIFSAKMKTPFISVSYEQKMRGFIEKIKYEDYCVDINDITVEKICEKFIKLEKNYMLIKKQLDIVNYEIKKDSQKTVNIILEYLKGDINETDIISSAELGRLADVSGDKQSTRM